MASVNLNALTEVQTPASTDNLLLFNETSNVATRIDYDKLAEAILNKTRNEIGGVSPISAIADLNSRMVGLCSRWENYASSLSITLAGNGNRTGILVLSSPSSTGCALACFMVGARISTGVASVEKISGTFDATVTATVTTSGELTLTASKSCNMAFIYVT